MPERQLQCIKTTSPYCIRKHFAGCMFFYLFWPIAHFSSLEISCHRMQRMCFGEIVFCSLIVCILPATVRSTRAKTESWRWSTSQKTARERTFKFLHDSPGFRSRILSLLNWPTSCKNCHSARCAQILTLRDFTKVYDLGRSEWRYMSVRLDPSSGCAPNFTEEPKHDLQLK